MTRRLRLGSMLFDPIVHTRHRSAAMMIVKIAEDVTVSITIDGHVWYTKWNVMPIDQFFIDEQES